MKHSPEHAKARRRAGFRVFGRRGDLGHGSWGTPGSGAAPHGPMVTKKPNAVRIFAVPTDSNGQPSRRTCAEPHRGTATAFDQRAARSQ